MFCRSTSANLSNGSQTRECTSRLVRLAEETDMAIFLVGHVTKEGNIAGPKVLEHMVDVVLYLEGDRFQAYRLLRSIKNRYGPTHEIGVFDMHEAGLVEVLNPSSACFCRTTATASVDRQSQSLLRERGRYSSKFKRWPLLRVLDCREGRQRVSMSIASTC